MNDALFDPETQKLEKSVEKVLVENNLEAVLYFRKIYKHWKIIVGESLARKTVPQKLEKKTLVVAVEDAAYSHHLQYFEGNILELIASPEICGKGIVQKIQFRVSSKSILNDPTREVSDTEAIAPPISDEILEQAKTVAQGITDKKLKSAFERYMSKALDKIHC